jgi:hypothetical protein
MPNNDITKLMEQLRASVIQQEDAVMERAGSSFGGIYADLEPYMLALNEAAAGIQNITPAQFKGLAAYKLLMDELDKQLAKYRGYIEVEYDNAIQDMFDGGSEDSKKILTALLGAGAVAQLTPEQMAALIANLKKYGHDYFEQLIEETKKETKNSLLDLAKIGGIAGLLLAFKDQLGAFLVSIIRFLRTAQIRAYREAMRASLLANGDVVLGWIWFAHLEGACLACAAMHGTKHSLDETLDDHPNGHCVMMPITILNPDANIPSGEDWFNGLTPEQQQQLMGPGKYEKWVNGEIKFEDLITFHTDDTYGNTIGVTPLKDL